MKTLLFKMDNLLGSLPHDSEEKRFYASRVKKYGMECGCSLGAKFLIASTGMFIVYFSLSNHFGIANLFKEILLGMFFIFTSSVAGKLIGIGMARIRLALLYKYLIAKYPVRGE